MLLPDFQHFFHIKVKQNIIQDKRQKDKDKRFWAQGAGLRAHGTGRSCQLKELEICEITLINFPSF
jgi:hypothetical protein